MHLLWMVILDFADKILWLVTFIFLVLRSLTRIQFDISDIYLSIIYHFHWWRLVFFNDRILSDIYFDLVIARFLIIIFLYDLIASHILLFISYLIVIIQCLLISDSSWRDSLHILLLLWLLLLRVICSRLVLSFNLHLLFRLILLRSFKHFEFIYELLKLHIIWIMNHHLWIIALLFILFLRRILLLLLHIACISVLWKFDYTFECSHFSVIFFIISLKHE